MSKVVWAPGCRQIIMKFSFVLFLLLALPGWLLAETYRCSNCNQEVARLYALRGVAGEKHMICANCYLRTPHCAICSLPIKKGEVEQLGDGRILCRTDFKAGIFSQEDATEIAKETRRELERTFYRFGMQFPETNVTISLVSADRISEVARARYNPRLPELEGFTVPKFYDQDGKELTSLDPTKRPHRIDYQIYLVNGVPRSRLTAICAHEFGHVWHLGNLPIGRSVQLERKTREAFCELLAYQLMGAMNQPYEQAVIEANLYTFGQSELLIEIEKNFGFNRILEWMKHGSASHLSLEALDQIQIAKTEATEPAQPIFSSSKPVRIPETLMLKGIMGSGAKKLALINNQTFSTSETAKVKIGTTNVSVQVVEIRDGSVLIRTNGGTQTSELFLQK